MNLAEDLDASSGRRPAGAGDRSIRLRFGWFTTFNIVGAGPGDIHFACSCHLVRTATGECRVVAGPWCVDHEELARRHLRRQRKRMARPDGEEPNDTVRIWFT